jgi:toxin ParE1/3/4
MPRLTIAAQARTALREIREYVSAMTRSRAASSLATAACYKETCRAPGLGRDRSHDLRHGLFSFPVGQYVIFYRIHREGIVIVNVIHGSRNLPRLI